MSYDAVITGLPPTAIVDLRGPAATVTALLAETALPLPHGPNRFAEAGGVAVAFVARQHWLLLASLEREDELVAALNVEGDVGAVLVSDAYAGFGVAGPGAGHILAQASPLDVHPSVFPQDGASFTEFFGQKALLMRRGGSFECRIDSSYRSYVADFLSRCGGCMA
jgi:heterotetrameric sarcosine oxidase gamma subunit